MLSTCLSKAVDWRAFCAVIGLMFQNFAFMMLPPCLRFAFE